MTTIDEIRIKRKNGQMFVVRFQPEASSPLDIEGMNLNISVDEIVKFVREGRKKITSEQIEEFKTMKGVAGVHLMAIEWEHKVPEIAERAKVLPRPVV